MSAARDYVLVAEKNKEEASQIAKDAAQKLQNKETTLLEVVQSLGEYINDEDEKIRGRAVSFLTALISALPSTYLSRQQIQVLCQFFCDRIEDGGAVDGLSKLQSLDRFTKDMAQTVVRALFDNFMDLKNRIVSIRHRVYQFLNELMQNHRKALLDMGDASLIGITNLVAGEKDPRNLMLVFSMLRVVMLEWDISNQVGTMFDSVYVYFPITFRARPDDPYQITTQDLKGRLRECLTCSSLLAQYAIPCLVDRLDSTSPSVKVDVLQTIAACCEHYQPGVMSQYSVALWDALKYEIIGTGNQELELADEALLTLRAIAICLSKSNNTSPTSSPLGLYLKPILKETLDELKNPASKQAKASGEVLKAVSSASGAAFEGIFKAVVPVLLSTLQSADSILLQRALLEVFNNFFESAIQLFGTWQSKGPESGYDQDALLSEFKDQFIAIYGQALMGTVKEEVSFRLTAAKGLLSLSQMRSYLQDNEIGLFVQYFDDIVLNEESYGRDELKRTTMMALAAISSSKPRLVMDITFPAFIARLPESEEDAARANSYQATLEGLAEISLEKELLETLIRRLINRLDLLFRSSQRGPFPYTCAILSTILYVFTRICEKAGAESGTLDGYYERIVVDLCARTVTQAALETPGPLGNEIVLDLLGRLDNFVIRNSSPQRLPQAAGNVYSLYSTEALDRVDSNLQQVSTYPKLLVPSTWILAALPRDIQASLFQLQSISAIIQDLISLSRKSPTRLVQLSCFRQVALYINKHVAPSNLQVATTILTELHESLSLAKGGNPQVSSLEFDIRLAFSISKALILRLAPKTNEVLSNLVALLESSKYSPEVSRLAAAGFGSILAPDDVLSKTNYFQIRLLAAQRVFQVLTPLISGKFKASSLSQEKQNYLTALSGVVATVPSEIVMPELPTLLPLLLQSLDLSDQAVKISTLETVAVVIANNPSALEESGHIPALVKRLLTSAALPASTGKAASGSSLPKTRRLATKCLALLPSKITGGASKTNPLLSLKQDVLRGLMRVLDDPRRDVRKEGVDARAAWLRSVDDPEDEDDDD